MISKEIFTVYHCKACNKIEVSQYITKEQMDVEGVKKYLKEKENQAPKL